MPASAPWKIPSLLEEVAARYEAERLRTYWETERPGVEAALNQLSRRLLPERFQPRQVLGVGGSGIVLRLSDFLFEKHDKALKFPRPVDGKIQLVAEMLRKEIRRLADLRHPGLVTIVDYGEIADVEAYGTLPFYLMDFVDGSSSSAFVRNKTTTADQLRRLVRSAAETLAYLHGQRVAHLDIKADNIMVNRDGLPVIIDLGTCKHMQEDEGSTVVACTRSNAHPALVRRLLEDPSDNNRAKGEIPRDEIDPAWDLWAFGLTILEWLGVDRSNGVARDVSLYRILEPYARKYYMLLVARLLSDSLHSWLSKRVGLSNEFLAQFKVSSAADMVECLKRLDGLNAPIDKIDELADPSSGNIQAGSGLHIPTTPALASVLEHRLYRRLNNITQLGLVSQVYPGAKHTRREHSLGTYANVARYLRALYNDSYSPLFQQIITEDDCRAVLLAALIHDLGQFPLAHDLEEIDKGIFSHSELTHAMLRGEWSRKRKGSKTVAFESLAKVFAQWGVSVERLAAILTAKPTSATASHRDKLLRSLFSGPIDADKLDYLLRDAAHTGVPYPLGIDVERLLTCITTVVLSDASAKDALVIGVHAKGRVAAEFMSLARYAMFSQVYWHHAVRAQKAMLARAIGALVASFPDGEPMEMFRSDFVQMVAGLPESLYAQEPHGPESQMDLPDIPKDAAREKKSATSFGSFGVGTDLMPTDAAVLSWFGEHLKKQGRPEVLLIEGLLRRELFKRLWVVSHDMSARRWDEIERAWDRLDRGGRNRASLEIEKALAAMLATGPAAVTALGPDNAIDMIRDMTAAEKPWLLIDIPGARPGSEIPLKYVLEGQRRMLRKDDRAVGDLQTSSIWETYAGDLRKTAGKIRVFCHPKLVDTVEASIPADVGVDVIAGELEKLGP